MSRLHDDAPATLEDARPVSPTAGLDDSHLMDAYSRAVVDVVDAVSPAVVHVQVRKVHGGRVGQGSGSGVVVSPDGLVLTNNHVIDGTQSISLSQGDGQRFGARLIGRDPDTDLAVLRAETSERLKYAHLADSKKVRQVRLQSRSEIRSVSSRPLRPASSVPWAAHSEPRTAV